MIKISYIVDSMKYNTWSTKNQNIIDTLVNREVLCCMTSEVEYMLGRVDEDDADNPFDESDCDNMYKKYCPICESSCGFQEISVGDLEDGDFKKENGYINDTDEWGDGYACPVCGLLYESAQQARECCDEDEFVYKCENCGKIYNQDEYDYLDERCEEVYEWWAVTNWLGEKLKQHGCIVIDSFGKSYWGRQTTGQSISLDGRIIGIATDMEILENMKYEWKL